MRFVGYVRGGLPTVPIKRITNATVFLRGFIYSIERLPIVCLWFFIDAYLPV